MATQAQIDAVANLHAFGNRTDVQAEYPIEMGYDIAHSDPYELATLIEEGFVTKESTELQVMTGFGVVSTTKSAVVFTYTDPNNINNVETYAVYVWSNDNQVGRWFYGKASTNVGGFTVDMTSLPNGDYVAKVEAEAYADGVASTPTADEAFTLA